MKFQTVLIIGLTILFASPSPACGPSNGQPMSNSSGSSAQSNSGQPMTPRRQWIRKRLRHLKNKRGEEERMQRGLDGVDLSQGHYPGRSSAYTRQRMIDRYEFLALKAERGRATASDLAEMKLLQNTLLSR
jgi:hypothetical protein